MPLETATYIHQLDSANPLGSDPIAAGDDHLRLIKAAIKATFPNITGPVTATQSTINSPFPVGGIIMWSGAVDAVPSGWSLCNGSNGTPDLRNRFVVGAGSGYAVGATGGADTVTLSEAQIPSHTHSATSANAGGHTHTASTGAAGGHIHKYQTGYQTNIAIEGTNGNFGGGTPDDGSHIYSTSTAGDHTHSVTVNSAGDHSHTITVAATGGGQAHENRPPYYALAYIMKLAY